MKRSTSTKNYRILIKVSQAAYVDIDAEDDIEAFEQATNLELECFKWVPRAERQIVRMERL